MKKGFIIAAVILVAVGAVLFAAAFIVSGFDFSKLDTAKYETNTYNATETFERIDIRLEEADVTFLRAEDGKPRVDCVEREKVRHDVFVENGTLKIVAIDKRAWYDHLLVFFRQSQSVTVYLPSERYDALSIAGDTGDVLVPNQFSFSDAEITASTGDVTFGASVDGHLKIQTDTGDIHLDEIHANAIDLSVSTGKIDGKNIRCNEALSTEVSTGKTVLSDITCKALYSNGSTGEVALKNVVASDRFSIKRNTGDVRFENCDAAQITVKTTTGDVTGTLRTEKVFIAKSSTGAVNVPDTGSGGKCEITTSTGDIGITIKN